MAAIVCIVTLTCATKVMAQDGFAAARFVPERKDDFAFENDKVAFRIYGPTLRDSKENSGVDCWVKRVDYPIIDKWYGAPRRASATTKIMEKDTTRTRSATHWAVAVWHCGWMESS